jgi:vancomycin resistance protein YoaR
MTRSLRIPLLLGIGGAYLLTGVVLGVTLLYQPGRSDVPLPVITVAGVEVSYDEPLRPQLVRIGREYLRGDVVLSDGRYETSLERRELGAYVDYAMLERRIRYLVTHRMDLDAFLRTHEDSSLEQVRLGLPVKLDAELARQSVLSIKYGYDSDPAPARLDMETRKVVPHEDGRLLMVDETLHNIEQALNAGGQTVELARVVLAPESTTAELQDLDIGTVLAWFETPYCLMKRCWDRNHNLELGGQLLDGTIIGPGEVFDFNETLGERSEARGFRPAPTIEAGVLVPTPGGGTCQTASTLYAASFFAGLEILTRRPHSRPSGYILLGLDATVSYPKVNLRMRNPYDFPVVIHYVVGEGKMRVEILGGARDRMVHFVRRITQRTPYKEKIVEKSDWPAGVRVVTQLGVDGYRVRRYRIQWEGSRAWREVTEDVYPPTPQIVEVGTNKSMSSKDFTPPGGDTHKPYQADKRIKFYMDENGKYQKIIANW